MVSPPVPLCSTWLGKGVSGLRADKVSGTAIVHIGRRKPFSVPGTFSGPRSTRRERPGSTPAAYRDRLDSLWRGRAENAMPAFAVLSVADRRGSGLFRSHFRRNGEVGEGRVVRPFREIITPFLPGEVAIGDLAGGALPGFEIYVPQHHAAPAAAAVESGRDGLAVGLKATLLTQPSFTGSGSSTRRLRAATSHSTRPPMSPRESGRDGLAVRAEGHAPNVALFHGKWLIDQAFACGHVPQHHAAADAAARIRPRWSCHPG